MKYVITGGAGFIGSNVVAALVAQGEDVTIIDNLSTGKRDNLSEFGDSVRFVEGDILDQKLLEQEFAGADYVIHMAAIGSVPRSVEDPLASHEANLTGTVKVLVAARNAQVKRVVFSGSSSAYGDSETLPKVETMQPNPISPYGLQKFGSEVYCRLFSELYNLDTVCLRYFNVFGPKQDPQSAYAAVIPLFIDLMRDGKQPKINGDGSFSRDFTYVDNVVSANLLACKAEGKLNGSVINVACGERITLLELVKCINESLGTTLEPILGPERAGDIPHSHADIGKAQELLGFKPLVLFSEGLKKTIEWYQK